MKQKKIKEKVATSPVIEITQEPAPTQLTRLLQWVATPILLAVVGFLFYKPSLNYPFQFDDLANITKFYSIRHATFKSVFFAHSRWISSWFNAMNYRMGANDPFAPYYYRLTNVSFHIIASLFLFFIFFLLLQNLKPTTRHHLFFRTHAFLIALFSAFLFLLHPTQTQAVSYVIQGRLEGLAGLAIISMALCFALFCHVKNNAAKYSALVTLFALAAVSCGTKEAAIVGPVLVALIDWFFIAQGDWQSFKKRIWLHGIVHFIVGLTFLYFLKPQLFLDILSLKREMHNNIGNTITATRTDTIRPLHYMISEFKVILHYLWIYLWPFDISVDYDWKMVSSFFAPDCILPFFCLAGIGYGIYTLLRRNTSNLFAFGLLWFFIAIAPRASIAASTELLADYKTYISSVGWLFAIASVLVYAVITLVNLTATRTPALAPMLMIPTQMAALVLVTAPVGFATYQRNMVWRSGEEFWANVLRNAPGRARAYNNYGVALSEKGDHTKAIPYFKKAAIMDTIYPDPLNNLAVAQSVLGNLDEAIDAIKRSLQINPYYPEAYNNLASFLLQKKEYAQAEQALKVALQIRPYYGKAYYNLGRIYAEKAHNEKDPTIQKQYFETAWQYHKNSCTIADFDNNVAGLAEYAKFSFHLQKYEDAIVALTAMLRIDPSLVDPLFALGNAYYFNKDFANARTIYQQLAQKTPNDARVWNNLGESCYQLGDYVNAVRFLAKAVTIDTSLFNAQLRVAEALSKVGQINDAKRVLEDLASRDVPAEIKKAANLGLAQIKQATAPAKTPAPKKA